MKRALAGLTTRGRSFVAAGVTAIVCAFILGERDLLRAGLLVLCLPVLSSLAVSRARYRLACARRLTPARLAVGQEARVDLRLKNVSGLPTGLLMVEDRVPYTLGGRARFLLHRIEPRGARELSYRVRSEVRGRYRVGPLVVRVADPFGLVELGRSFKLADSLMVTPAIVELPPGRMTGSRGGGDGSAHRMATAGEDDVAAREYRHGDDLRRVHWRSTARRGELMVRREEQHSQNTGVLFLDTRRSAYPGQGPSSSFEQAVSAAASIGVRMIREGVELRLATDTGRSAIPSATAAGSPEGAILDALAVVRRSGGRSLTPGLAAMRSTTGGDRDTDGMIVGVFGALGRADVQALASARHGTALCVAVLVDAAAATPEAGAGGRTGPPSPGAGSRTRDEGSGAGRGEELSEPGTSGSAALLRAAGWRVIVIDSAAALGAAWAKIAAPNGTAGGAVPAPAGSATGRNTPRNREEARS